MLGPGYHLAQQQDRESDGQGITTASDHHGLLAELELVSPGPV